MIVLSTEEVQGTTVQPDNTASESTAKSQIEYKSPKLGLELFKKKGLCAIWGSCCGEAILPA